MNHTVIYRGFATLAVLILVTGCSIKYKHSIMLRGYTLAKPIKDAANDALRFDIDTLVAAEGRPKVYVTNTSSVPLILHKKFANLSRADTVLRGSPFVDNPFTEYSFSTSSSSTFSGGAGRSGVNPYAITSDQLLSSSTSSLGIGVSSGTVVTRKPMSEVVLYPNQVIALELEDLVSSTLGSTVRFTYTNEDRVTTKASIQLTSTSTDQQYIQQGISALRQNFVEFGWRPYTLHFVYSDINGTNLRTASFPFKFNDLDLKLKSVIVD